MNSKHSCIWGGVIFFINYIGCEVIFILSNVLSIYCKVSFIANAFGIVLNLSLIAFILFLYENKVRPLRYKINKRKVKLLFISLLFTVSAVVVLNFIYELRFNLFNEQFIVVDFVKIDCQYLSALFYFQRLIYAPIFEEVFYRDFLQKIILKKQNSYIAIICSAVIFALFHFDMNKIFFTFLGGLIFGFLYHKTTIITIPILSHFICNLMYTVCVFYCADFNLNSTFIFLCSLVLLVFSILFIQKQKKEIEKSG